MNNGFVKIPRSIIDWRWYTDANTYRLYLHLFYKASFKECEWHNENLQKGQVIVGRKQLAKELDISESQVRTALSKLESSGDITIKPTNKYSLITLLKWEEYEESNYFFTNESPTNHQQIANKSPHNNKYNNLKNVNNKNARAREKTNFVKSGSIDWEAMDMIINGGMQAKISE